MPSQTHPARELASTLHRRLRRVAGAFGATGPPRRPRVPPRRPDVALHNMHTGEIVRTVYFADGRYLPRAACGRSTTCCATGAPDEIVAMDPKVVDILYLLQRALDPDGPLEVVCGYRSPATNAMLRRAQPGGRQAQPPHARDGGRLPAAQPAHPRRPRGGGEPQGRRGRLLSAARASSMSTAARSATGPRVR